MSRIQDTSDWLIPPEETHCPTDFHLQEGDCVVGMRKNMPGESVDLVVTSPPYNLGIDYKSYKDDLDQEAYLKWTVEWASEVKRVLKEDGSFFLNVGAVPRNPFMPHEVVLALRDVFTLQNTIHWIKSITVRTTDEELVSAGHFKPINSPRFLNDCHEFIFHFTKTGKVPVDRLAVGVPYADKSNIARWGHTRGEDKRCRGNTWFIPYKTIKFRDKDRPHPATFPVELAENCIRLHGKGKKTVMLDPFLGIGHAAVAARNREIERFFGFEIDPVYLDAARHQIKGATW